MIRIVLAEDHHLVRLGLNGLLAAHSDLELVGEASDGFEAVAVTQKCKPDVLVLDLTLPNLHGLEVIRQVRESSDTQIVVLSMHSAEALVLEAFRAGAAAYVVKDGTLDELVGAIRAVKKGDSYINPILRRSAVTAAFKITNRTLDPYEGLTRQERNVLQLAAEGKSSALVGKLLHISSRTVEGHRASLMKKLSLSSQTDLVRFAIRRKIIEP